MVPMALTAPGASTVTVRATRRINIRIRGQFGFLPSTRHGHLKAGTVGWLPGGSVAVCEQPTGAGFVDGLEEVLVASVIAFDVNETLLDLRAHW
jgi:hypothetical protein